MGRAEDGVGDCPICLRGEPLGILVERTHSWITADEQAETRDYLCVVAKRHVVEPFELDGDARAAFWEDVLFAAERLAALVKPRKVNYEIHGNTIPHLHTHVFAREPAENVSLDDLRKALA
jgi:diadenosine tetraphosphate (Ap4A) HIT family hydrolase